MRLVVLLLAASLLLVACSPSTAGDTGGEGTVGFATGDGTVTIVPEDEREAAPILEGPSLDGGTLSTVDLIGSPVVINVWGSWCAPCRSEAPELVEATERLGDDVKFLGLNTRDLDQAPAQAFVRAFEIPYPNIFDPDGTLLLGFGQVPPKAIPSTLVIDAEGRVAARVIGEVNANTLVALVGDVG